jgi:hypothetical protein
MKLNYRDFYDVLFVTVYSMNVLLQTQKCVRACAYSYSHYKVRVIGNETSCGA